ncbi:MAG: prohibitin family protein, partial [Gammaproteobacteria bacterium]|nr:prohibitin family protein [Gammaproteobacteria bacterium]
ERRASEEKATQVRILADAKAYEIEKINRAIANNPAYIQLQALESLKSISKDPASKVYFINGDSPMPLPLMHLGEKD